MQLDLVYAQYGILYKIILDAPRSNTDLEKPKLGLHTDDIIGSVHPPIVESLEKQIHDLSVKQSAVDVAKDANSSL